MKKSQSALWSANVDLKKNSQLKKFCDQLESKGFIRNKSNFKNLWKWSIKNNEKFWSEVWDFTKIKGDKKNKALEYSSPVLNLSLEKLFISIQSWIPKTFQIIQCS